MNDYVKPGKNRWGLNKQNSKVKENVQKYTFMQNLIFLAFLLYRSHAETENELHHNFRMSKRGWFDDVTQHHENVFYWFRCSIQDQQFLTAGWDFFICDPITKSQDPNQTNSVSHSQHNGRLFRSINSVSLSSVTMCSWCAPSHPQDPCFYIHRGRIHH